MMLVYYLLYFLLYISASPAEEVVVVQEEPQQMVYASDNAEYKVSAVEAVLEQMIRDRDLKHASWGFCLINTETGAVISSYDMHRSLTPASTQKIFSTSVIFSLLDPDHRFETYLQYDGELDKSTGVLHGNIYIKGGGDPTLASREIRTTGKTSLLRQWVRAIRDAGIKEINGAVIGDATFFDDDIAPSSWSYGDMGNYYGAAATGLTFADNTFRVYFRSGYREGEPTEVVDLQPAMPGLTIHNIVTTGAYNSWDNAYIHGAPLNDLYVIKGTIPPGKKLMGIKAAIPDPPLFAAQQLLIAMERSGIKASAGAAALHASDNNFVSDTGRTIIHTHKSPPLLDIVKKVNEESINLYAEHILKLIGKERYGIASTEKGLDAILAYYRSKGMPTEGFSIYDGSGLSRRNTVTPYQMAKALSIASQDTFFTSFYNTLAVAGHTGTFMGMCGNISNRNRDLIRGKSGTLTGVKAYSGYVRNYDGQLLAFAMIANNYTCSNYAMRNKWERLMCRLVNVQEI